MICTILIILCTIIYLLSCAEIIGSRILTKKKQDVRWALSFSVLPILFPPLAPIAASDSIYYAKMMYDRNSPNVHHFQESLYEYLKHNRMSIDEWAEKNKSEAK